MEVPINFVIIVSFLFLGIYFVGFYNFLTGMEQNMCHMTYMFQFPQFVEIAMPLHIDKRYPRYRLYGYSEGETTHALRKMYFTGIPVLFIPGSGGSQNQVRSLASVALRKALDSRSSVHFDFFTIKFDEDLSGLYGGVLEDQTNYVQISITKILALYHRTTTPEKPKSVILVGHSLGGVIAKGVLTNSDFDKNLVNVIITLATPHLNPVVEPDPYFLQYYENINNNWHPRSSNLSHVTLVSIGGGERDLIVRSDLTYDKSADINVLSSAIPGVWCSTDHLSIVWCKQLVITIVRALFDLIDLRTKHITLSPQYRLNVFKYHLIQRSAGKKFLPHPVKESFTPSINWVENLQRQWSFSNKNGPKLPQIIMIRLINDIKHEALLLEAINLNIKDWVYVCSADDIYNSVRICDSAINLSNATEILPTSNLRRKIIHLNLMTLKHRGYSHVIVHVPQLSSFVQLNIDVHRISDRVSQVTVPRLWSFGWTQILEQTNDNAVFYSISFNGWEQIWQSYVVNIDTIQCKSSVNHGVFSFTVPWANNTQHFVMADKPRLTAILKLTSTKPLHWNSSDNPMLRLILDPTCKYKVSMKPALTTSAGQFVRYYTTLLPGYVMAIILLTFRKQMQSLHKGKGIPIFHSALAQAVRNYYTLLQITVIGSKLFRLTPLSVIFPQPDATILQDQNLDFFFLPIFLYGVSAAMVYVMGAAFYCGIVISGQTVHKMALRLVAKTITGLSTWSEWLVSGLQSLPIIASILFVALSCSSVGGLAVILASGFYFLKICKMYEDYLETLLAASLKFVARTIKNVTIGESTSSPNDDDSSESQKDSQDTQDERKDLEKSEDVEENDDDDGVQATEEAENEQSKNNEENEKLQLETIPEMDEKDENIEEIPITTLQEIHFHVTLCLLYIITSLITVPSVLAWAKSFYENKKLLKDSTMIPSAILCALSGFLWKNFEPKPNPRYEKITSIILMTLASVAVMFCTTSHYRLPYVSLLTVFYLICEQRF